MLNSRYRDDCVEDTLGWLPSEDISLNKVKAGVLEGIGTQIQSRHSVPQ